MDWPQPQLHNRAVITSMSPESLGTLLPRVAVAASGLYSVANLATFTPVMIYRPYTVVKLGYYNGSAQSGNIDLGIYDEAGNRLVSSGSTAQGSASVWQWIDTTDITLAPGRYYMASAANSTSAAAFGPLHTVQSAQASGILQMATAFALPNPATFATVAQSTRVPILGLAGRTAV